MPTIRYRPSLKTLQSQGVILEAKTVYTTRGPRERLTIRNPLKVNSRTAGNRLRQTTAQEEARTSAGNNQEESSTSEAPNSLPSWEDEPIEPLKVRVSKVKVLAS